MARRGSPRDDEDARRTVRPAIERQLRELTAVHRSLRAGDHVHRHESGEAVANRLRAGPASDRLGGHTQPLGERQDARAHLNLGEYLYIRSRPW